MRARFWGTRGSIATPGPSTLRYGGNTSCVEVRAGGILLVLDCGTGAHALGRALLEEGERLRGNLLISHTHWDHIQGLPFFAPLFEKGGRWNVYGPRGLASSLRDALAGQMQYTYFPVSLEQCAAEIHYHDLVEGSFEIEGVRITARYLNHPALVVGYRIEAGDAVLVYATDHEPHLPHPADPALRRVRSAEDDAHARFVQGSDLLIHDAQYTDDEHTSRVGWGHSSVGFAVDLARDAGVRRLALFHHDPLRDDEALDRMVQAARERAGAGLQVFAAAEGLELALDSPQRRYREPSRSTPAAHRDPGTAAALGAVLLGGADAEVISVLCKAARADGLTLLRARTREELLRAAESEPVSLVVLRREVDGHDAHELCRELRAVEALRAADPPVVVVADWPEDVELEAGAEAGVTDWLVWPFKETYARTRLHCWLLRVGCRWIPAPRPEAEARRLRALHELRILDTPPEERFDRITRIAAALFEVPIALVSLVDRERQWFKSRYGLDVSETPREMALCAYAVLGEDPMVVSDALRDDRFADNPLVTGPPTLRFYAGVPLRVSEGDRVGTLCLIDHRPRALGESEIALLRDLGTLVETELAREGPSTP
jgi:phosphoribosyl 1,2-cyclic phosphodiesterase/DNA-binding response OmpR family regulator